MSRCGSSFGGYVRNGNLSKRRFIDDGVANHCFWPPSALVALSGGGDTSASRVLPLCDMASIPIYSNEADDFFALVQSTLIKLVR